MGEPMTQLEILRKNAHDKLLEAERAMYAYACECEVGPERTWAFRMYDYIRVSVPANR